MRHFKASEVWLVIAIVLCQAHGMRAASVFETPVSQGDIDLAATADWAGGVLRTNPAFYSDAAANQPTRVLFTRNSKPLSGWSYGASSNPGPRHVRIGFVRIIAVGTVLTTGDSHLSVLRANAPYPGNLGNEADWLPAQRVEFRQVATNFPNASAVSTWVLPPATSTRALRFSHVSEPADPVYQGKVTGAYVLADRFANIAPQAVPLTSSNQVKAPLIVNYISESSGTVWENGPLGGSSVVSSATPEQVLLVWPTNVTLAGLCALHAGFSEAAVFRYIGPSNRHPREALVSDWTPVSLHSNIQFQVPRSLTPNWLDFDGLVTTRAVRLLITKASDPNPYLNVAGGKRVTLGELMALMPLGGATLESSILPPPPSTHPPIPIPLNLNAPGFVTLVIEDASGKRVRNLLAETHYAAGSHTIWWDGLDESGRITTGSHGNYDVQGNLVAPGNYRARGLVRDQLELRYEFSVGTDGKPPWKTGDRGSGGWLADHRPPSDMILLPGTNAQMLIGSEISESGDGLVWTDLEGRKLKGRNALAPGGFYSASHLAYDAGSSPASNVMAYSGVAVKKEVFLYGISIPSSDPITLPSFKFASSELAVISGLAARNGVLFASLGEVGQIVTVDAKARTILATNSVASPRGLAFDAQGRLVVLSGDRLIRFSVNLTDGTVEGPQTIVAGGLDEPRKLAIDPSGNIYVSLWGDTHQVHVFNSSGNLLRRIGNPGPPGVGPYDRQHMNYPQGVAIAADGRLWVAEYDVAPKRISIWTPDGMLVKALEGPPKYGGGGRLDPLDKTRFYYGDKDPDEPVPYFMGMEYRLDWNTGSNWLVNVYYRVGTNEFHLPGDGPDTAIYLNNRQYMVNSLNANPVTGTGAAGIWQMRGSIAVPVAAAGMSSHWDWLARPEFASRIPAGSSLNNTMFAWSDLNDDGVAQPAEVSFQQQPGATFLVTKDLAFLSGRSLLLPPRSFTPLGAPVYQLADARLLIAGITPLGSSGGGQMFAASNGCFVLTGGPMVGYLDGQISWTYPSQWPSLHASQSAPVPSYPGQMIGTTRLLGLPFAPKQGEAGEVWAVNGNLGNIYLMTVDGLFIATLFKDVRTAPAWSMAQNTRGILVNGVSLLDECFWPSITQVANGEVYLTVGKNHSALVRLDGLDSIRRLPVTSFTVTTQQLAEAAAYLLEREAGRISTVGRDTLEVASFNNPPAIDGSFAEWQNNKWAIIDERTSAAVSAGQGRLYAAFRTGDGSLLTNSGTSTELLFKTGGALDLMIGTDNPAADPDRNAPTAGDLRLLISKSGQGIKATLYRPAFTNAPNPVTFSSPIRSISFDRVDDVSASVTLAATANGDFELSVPLSVLGLNPSAGQIILGDMGILRGRDGQTIQRVYWQNKSTVLVSDIPSEAQLTPKLWGRWLFQSASAGRPQSPTNLRILSTSRP